MKRILLIDDNPEDRMLYRRFLGQQSGFQRLEIVEASSGADGLEQFRLQQPDCVLLDYNLPDTDGLDLLVALRELAPPETLCVVMITGGGNESLAVRALNSGALDYLVKQQFDRELLNKTVLHAIEKNEWRQYVARYHGELQGVNRELRDSLAELTEIRQELNEKNAQLSAANQEIGARNRLLARTNQDLDNFVYAASHDLRQPLDNLRGLFDELRRTATFQDPEEAVVMRLLEDSLHSLSTTITDLAAVVQEQRSPGEQSAEQVTFASLVADVLKALRPQLEATDAHVDTDFSALPALRYVRSSLRTILINLLGNALKYRHPDRAPHIQVRTYQADGCPVLEVSDNGLGMNMDRHGNELFQLFRRFHPQVGEGTGVGLFLVNRLVQSESGHIAVESEEGQGTVFRVFLHGKRGNC
ncbi:hybrid sensor histidine kinase/response regulator [Microvirga sp. STS02]|uniref:sensor histidine kinase n=1 Tax=Hymenobacter negativus TaxID=2795026 RepID=UPI0018DCD186|nr:MULTISPECIES: hybrid sensor histidine kinase/response regulator [Bacteria]MBH8569536.1 hybrid sensor histidine kinase/response regulator [Hymenobacter negativus]MBR7209272.1 hybrid sensor histidine kinase/response regulator [Microvirga sp. STS02]